MGSGGGCIAPNVIDTGAWSHLVLTYDGSNVKLYINGTLASSGAKTGKLGYTDSSLRIGLGIPGNSLQYFKGWIDDVRIYNRAITPAEVSTLYSNTTALENPSQHTGTWFYPNPAVSSLTLTDMAIEDIHLYNMNGQLVDFQRSGSTISLSTLPAGIYVITGNLNGAVLREKLIVNQ
jgi:hypothetical protein